MFGLEQFIAPHFSMEHFLGLTTVITIFADGRRPTTVNTPPRSGDQYPFVHPSADVTRLFADLWFEHSGDFTPGFRIHWLGGFGTDPTVGTVLPLTHVQDLIIVDAFDQVAFDSREDDVEFYATKWGENRMRLIQWWTADSIVRCSIYRGWGATDTQRTYSSGFYPESAWLAARTYSKAPARLRGIIIGSTTLTGAIDLEPVYNVDLSPVVATRVDGEPKSSSIEFRANPGDGRGRFPGCEDTQPVLRYINDVPTTDGRFRVEFGDCLRGDQKLAIVNGEAFPAITGETAEDAAATMYLRNDCGVCCDCVYFLNTYKALKRQYARNAAVIADINETHEIMEDNRQRYIEQKICREAQPLQLEFLPEPAGRFTVAASYCNLTPACITPVQLQFQFELFENNLPVDAEGDAVQCGVAFVGTKSGGRPARRSVAGTFPTWSIYFDSLAPYDAARASFRFCLPAPADNKSLRLTVSVHSPQPLPTEDGTNYVLPTLPSPAATTTGPARAVSIQSAAMNPASVFSVGCQC